MTDEKKWLGEEVLLQRVIFLVVLLAINALAFADSTSVYKVEEYTVQPGDVLGVSVWKESDLQLDVVVRPDGGFSMPLIGEIDTAGKTIESLRRELADKLQNYISDAVVTVFAKQLFGNRIFVIGQVNRPGEIVLNSQIDVLQALSKAGGMTAFAAEDEVKILRREGGKQKVFTFEYSEVETGNSLDKNIILKSGDVVVVP